MGKEVHADVMVPDDVMVFEPAYESTYLSDSLVPLVVAFVRALPMSADRGLVDRMAFSFRTVLQAEQRR
jgi:hypothetical protein